MKLITLIILLAIALHLTSCNFKNRPEDEMTEWTLLRIEDGSRDNKPTKIQVWQVKGIERQIDGWTDLPIGIIKWWPTPK